MVLQFYDWWALSVCTDGTSGPSLNQCIVFQLNLKLIKWKSTIFQPKKRRNYWSYSFASGGFASPFCTGHNDMKNPFWFAQFSDETLQFSLSNPLHSKCCIFNFHELWKSRWKIVNSSSFRICNLSHSIEFYFLLFFVFFFFIFLF